MKTSLFIKRIYEPVSTEDGFRVLVDRVWPRGFTKEKAAIDVWMKEIAPSTELRKWFNHEPAKWEVFCEKYLDEIKANENSSELIKICKGHKVVTLLYGAKDEEHNQAVVLLNYIQQNL